MGKEDSESKQERFKLLYNTLEKYNERFVSASMTTATALIVVIGWVLTSANVQAFFRDSIIGVLITSVAVAVLIGVYLNSMFRVYDVNKKTFKMLIGLDYLDKTIYEHHELPTRYLYFGIGLNVGLYLVIIALVMNCRWKFLYDL